ncbi:MAG: 1-deoxy-D-xylulose-5-phosphate reductoisomerase [Candidatus Omnitrophota bacterium]
MKRIAILGSTGSIGCNTLKVIKALPGQFQVVGLSAYSDIATLSRQLRQFNPKWIHLADESSARVAQKQFPSSCNVLSGHNGLRDLIRRSAADIVVLAIAGADALMPLLETIKLKKTVILANKEALVIAGDIIMRRARKNQVKILPVDSEQSAIWQCLDGKEKREIRRIYLTASGGPFKNYTLKQLKGIRAKDASRHPRWDMGRRITVDSGTLMNKGLEIIEAMRLFGLGLSQIEVIIHPEAVIHSMVEFIDGSILAQISVTDMRIPIQHALTYPERLKSSLKPLDFFKLKRINFHKPDMRKFPCLKLAIEAAKEGGSLPCVLNAADEVAVDAFLNKRISFIDIPRVIARVIDSHKKISNPSLDDILDTDAWARSQTQRIIKH